MGTLPSNLTSAPSYFSGVSDFSQDLNNAVSRAVQIAGFPIQLLQNDVIDLNGQYDELEKLSGDFNQVQSAIDGLASAATHMLAASVSDPALAEVTLGSTATAGSYRLLVSSLGSHSNALSTDELQKVTNPSSQNISASAHYTLTVKVGSGDPVSTPIAFSGGNLNVLASAINQSGAGVEATVVNVGTNSHPDYRLSLQSAGLGPVSMQLNDGTRDLLATSGAAGELAQYTINGKTVYSDSDTVTLAPGLTVRLTGEDPEHAAAITVAADPSGVGTALQTLVSAYNTVVSELDNNRGQTAMALAGQSIIYELTSQLRHIANYSAGSGNIWSLSSLGVTFNDMTGRLSFDQSVFALATLGNTPALTGFLGSTTGGGFLKAATSTLNSVLQAGSGLIPQAISSNRDHLASVNADMADKQAALSLLQSNLTQQMAAADSLIYGLQQQSNQLKDMFTALYYRTGTN